MIRRLGVGLIVAAALFAPAGAAEAGGTTFVVTKTADTADGACDADCSLREAIIAANLAPGADEVTVPAGTYTLTIPGRGEGAGATGDLNITEALTLSGDAANTTVIDAAGLDGAIGVDTTNVTVISKLGVQNGDSGGNFGGGIANFGALVLHDVILVNNESDFGGGGLATFGTTTLSRVTIAKNSSGLGGGGMLTGGLTTTTIQNSTISGNTVVGSGGGVFNTGQLTVVNSTISGNTQIEYEGGESGGGIFNHAFVGGSGTINLSNTTVAFNVAEGLGDGISTEGPVTLHNTILVNAPGENCLGAVASLGHNLDFDGSCGLDQLGDLIGAQPMLVPLQNNGGPTETHALSPGGCAPPPGDVCIPQSAAINAGDNDGCPASDQRGAPRPLEKSCDIGAYEYGDADADGAVDPSDNCPTVPNLAGQAADSDGDLAGDACDAPGTGNVDCSGPVSGVSAVDALKVIRYKAGLAVEQSEPCTDIGAGPLTSGWMQGDVNCSGGVSAVDGMLILRVNVGLAVSIPAGCPEIKPPG